MIKKDSLLIPGDALLSIINVNEYNLVRKIKVGSNWINGVCMFNKKYVTCRR